MKTLSVPESVYEEVKHFANQVSVKQEINAIFKEYGIETSHDKKAILKQLLSELSKYDKTNKLAVKGLILSLLFLKYGFTKHDAFTILEEASTNL